MKDDLGAFVEHTDVRMEGRGGEPLTGFSLAVKDLFDIAGYVTGCGNPDWFRTHGPAHETAPVVERLLAGGASVIGKTHLDELAFSTNGENAHYGAPKNPKAPGRIPGGSSSGSAAAVAGGLADIALGSDTGCSVRAPASFCGVYGLRPTHGRIPLEGAMPLAPSFDTVGWFAREAGVMADVGRVLFHGWREPEAPARLLVPEDAWALADASAQAALRPLIERVAAHTGPPESITLAEEGIDSWFPAARNLLAWEVWKSHGAWITAEDPAFGPDIADRFKWAASITEEQMAEANRIRPAAAARINGVLEGGAVMVMPTAPGIAPLLGLSPSQSADFRDRLLKLSAIGGLAGVPQINLPLAEVEGCPVGLSLIAGRGGDEMLLELARRISAG
ncbi:MAG: amidase [bacterium]